MTEDIRSRYVRLFETGANTDRTMFFSDAVMAIAMTLLVLEIKVPPVAGSGLGPALLGELHTVGAYVLSFVLIGFNWILHHRKFTVITRFDTGLQWINLAYLFFVATLPLPTAILSEYGAQTLAVTIYAAVLSATALAQISIWVHAWRHHLMTADVDRTMYRYAIANQLPQPIIFAFSIVLCLLFSPAIAMYSWILLIPAQIVVSRLAARRGNRALAI